ncbi:hypothetical protein BDB00DRAFT_853601 [Zychaea mexicana]|uniref:uncharacterized protein n=1 Tax=Zychaea mexicana TaxID=64656 RepID=UPI0022FF0710|nr:uncharacterized protein BDB00DRAFT_853601 [Zychaea mexicana]KAI9484787.1 hypothetical protein BDB00DRAFT_853601 [Zychaea mexicana]
MSFNIHQKRKQTTKAYRFLDKGKKLIRLTSTVNKSTASDITTPFEIRASSLPAISSLSDGWSTDDEVDEVDYQSRRQTAAVKRAVAEALEPATHKMCGCAADKKAHKAVTCIFKCGIRQFDIEYCKSCPDYALPLVLMRSHMIPLTPKAPSHAVHIKQSTICITFAASPCTILQNGYKQILSKRYYFL